MLSVVIPSLDAAAELPRCLAALDEGRAQGLVGEVVIADGGSSDETAVLARAAGAKCIIGPKGRGRQLRQGAAAAGSEWLMFLHADTVLAEGWAEEARAFIADPANAERAAVFRFALDDAAAASRRLERLVALRCRWLGLAYGDQGLLISRAFYRRLGGFRDLPLMEDVELARRIGRRRLHLLQTPAITSAVRYRRSGYLARGTRNLLCLTLYSLGVPARAVARLYG